MAMLGQDPNERYRVRPRTVVKKPEDDPQPPTAKTPVKVAVPVPVPIPTPVETSAPFASRYKITPQQMDFKSGQPVPSPPQPRMGEDVIKRDVMQPFYPTSPMGDTATAPPTDSTQASTTPDEIPAWLQSLRDAEAQRSADESAPVKKDKWYTSMLKMLAYGAKDMPPARDWGEFAYGAGRSLGSGITGAIKHDLPGQIEKRYRVAADQQRVEAAQKTAGIESQIQSRADTQKIRVARLNRDLSKDEIARENVKRKAVSEDLRRLPYIDPSNPVHAKILERAKAAGIDVDPASFGKGKARPRITVLDDDGVTRHIMEKDPQKGWVPISIEGKNAIAGLTEKRNPLTGEAYSSEQRRQLAKDKFDFDKIEAKIHDGQRERALALQSKGMDQKIAAAQGEVDAIDSVMPELEGALDKATDPTSGDELIAESIRSKIATLKDRRGRAAGTAGVASTKASEKTYKYTEDEVRKRAQAMPGSNPTLVKQAVDTARERGLIPPQ